MIRNTSPVGWIPLLAIKVLREGSLIPFIISGIFVAIPVIAICVASDTLYYGGEELVLTGKNFLEVNVIQGLSKFFGTDPFYWYFVAFAPSIYTVIYPFTLTAVIRHAQTCWSMQ